jgi:ABC-type multidrug transport system permease subunit
VNTADITTERLRPTLAQTLRDSRVMARRQLRKVSRRPTYLSLVLVQPVMFVLLFRYVFGGAIDTGSIAYVDFLLPGIIVMTAIFGALTTGIGLTEDLPTGVVDRFRSLPIARSSVLAFAYVFSWISAFIGLAVKDPETAQTAGFLWVLPLTFASSAFVPTDSMPTAVQAFADVNPVTLAVDATRALTVGDGDALAPALGTVAWLIALLVVFVPLAVRAFRAA